MFVSVTNVTHINSTNIDMYACSVLCLHVAGEEKEERERKSGKGATTPPYFFENNASLFLEYIIYSLLVGLCVWEE